MPGLETHHRNQTAPSPHHPHLLIPTASRCEKGMKENYGGYMCKSCNFVAHLNYTTTFVVEDSVVSAASTVNDVKPEDDDHEGEEVPEVELGPVINHWSHLHRLVLIDKDGESIEAKEEYYNCDGCKLPIFSPFYGCKECNFFLDKKCIFLPQQIKDQNHPHPLTLLANAKEKVSSVGAGLISQVTEIIPDSDPPDTGQITQRDLPDSPVATGPLRKKTKANGDEELLQVDEEILDVIQDEPHEVSDVVLHDAVPSTQSKPETEPLPSGWSFQDAIVL
ncbi:hypothetical protein Tsubulata_050506 [Turnera subulata]|uniref:DC1 domain-containing protein n=1 Tax=Turnera subulata TaxID=218843 RepID=A0A9Q0J6K7_9ROSI|nr:hypothetical protein Tsubulata_050506 [Turnera subulata]